jgi:predicted GIY-YIG superfamily endonuclease
MEQMWYLYILRCRDGSLYTGITTDVEKRFEAHQAGRGAKYTRGRGPLELVYRETCGDHSAALKRELEMKKLPRERKLRLIEKYENGTE